MKAVLSRNRRENRKWLERHVSLSKWLQHPGSRLEYKEDDKSTHQVFIHFPLFQSLQHLTLSQNQEQQKLCEPIKNWMMKYRCGKHLQDLLILNKSITELRT